MNWLMTIRTISLVTQHIVNIQGICMWVHRDTLSQMLCYHENISFVLTGIVPKQIINLFVFFLFGAYKSQQTLREHILCVCVCVCVFVLLFFFFFGYV